MTGPHLWGDVGDLGIQLTYWIYRSDGRAWRRGWRKQGEAGETGEDPGGQRREVSTVESGEKKGGEKMESGGEPLLHEISIYRALLHNVNFCFDPCVGLCQGILSPGALMGKGQLWLLFGF